VGGAAATHCGLGTCGLGAEEACGGNPILMLFRLRAAEFFMLNVFCIATTAPYAYAGVS
jgi:hypothetical protein